MAAHVVDLVLTSGCGRPLRPRSSHAGQAEVSELDGLRALAIDLLDNYLSDEGHAGSLESQRKTADGERSSTRRRWSSKSGRSRLEGSLDCAAS